MGRKVSLLLAVLLLLAGHAAGSTPRGYENGGSTCSPLRTEKLGEPPHCPRASQQGSVVFQACEEPPSAACLVRVDARAHGSGFPLLSKTLATEAYHLGGAVAQVCAAQGVGKELECKGDALVQVAVAEGACRELRVRTTFRDAVDAEDGVAVIVQAAFQACRTGGVLRVS